jgi:hypothetical protein
MTKDWYWSEDRECSKHACSKVWSRDETELIWALEVYTEFIPFSRSFFMGTIRLRGTLDGGNLTMSLETDEEA